MKPANSCKDKSSAVCHPFEFAFGKLLVEIAFAMGFYPADGIIYQRPLPHQTHGGVGNLADHNFVCVPFKSCTKLYEIIRGNGIIAISDPSTTAGASPTT
jgi:hypothetical protein